LGCSSREIVQGAQLLGIQVRRAAALLTAGQEQKIREAVTSGFIRRRGSPPPRQLPVPPLQPEERWEFSTCQCCLLKFSHDAGESPVVCNHCEHHYRLYDESVERTLERLSEHEERLFAEIARYREANNQLEQHVHSAYGKRDKWMQALVETVLAHEPAEDQDGCVCGAAEYPCVTRRYLPQINRGIAKRVDELDHMSEGERDRVLYGRRPSLHDSFEQEEVG
jgi:hypothetical protein